jgi:hypothetical protein
MPKAFARPVNYRAHRPQPTDQPSLISVLENPRAKTLVEQIEQYQSDDPVRFADEIQIVARDLYNLTGYKYTV